MHPFSSLSQRPYAFPVQTSYLAEDTVGARTNTTEPNRIGGRVTRETVGPGAALNLTARLVNRQIACYTQSKQRATDLPREGYGKELIA